MAVDDITVVIHVNIAAAATFDRQPSGGVEELLLSVGSGEISGTAPDKAQDMKIQQIDGTNNDAVLLEGDGGETASVWFRMKMMATNTNYFRFTNRGSVTRDCSVAVIAAG